MKVTRDQAAQNRARIVELAARRFRECGFSGIGVSDLMHEAGLTHGGFYGHFASKEDLMAEACATALVDSIAGWQQVAQKVDTHPLARIRARYLSAKHRNDPGSGCLIAALGSDIARQSGKVRGVVTQGVRELIDLFARLSPRAAKTEKRKQAIMTLAEVVGALVLARMVDDARLSDEILRVVAGRDAD